MLKNYLKIFFRNMLKHPGYSLSNISSLAIGMTTCTLILLFVRYEMNWNTYNKNYDHAYRVQQKVIFKDDYQIYSQTGFQVASQLKQQVPEIENSAVTRFIWDEYLSSTDELTFDEKGGCYADGNLFKVLTFEFVEGDSATALSEPYSIVITQDLAQKYFPGENVMGKIIKASKNKILKVTGVIKNLPYNLDFRPDYFVSMETYKEVTDWKDYDKIENIAAALFNTFVTLKPNVSYKDVNEKIYNFQDQFLTDNYKKIYFKPLPELHLTADERNDVEIALYYIGAFAILVLILASINYINLSTANSFLRKKEIGIRKVVGASRVSLFSQFIGEALIYAIASMAFTFLVVELLLPSFNTVVERHIDIQFFRDIKFIAIMFVVFIVTGFLSGVYPALYLSNFRALQVIKGNVSLFKNNKGSSKNFLRKSLVSVQFCISVLLLTSTIYVVNQVHFMKTKDLGFDKEDILICYVYGSKANGSFETLRNQLLTNPDITGATVSSNAPFHGNWGKEINWEGGTAKDNMSINYNMIDYDYIDTYKMKLVLGRNFLNEFSTDSQACLINETAWKSLGWENPIGKKIDNNNYTIVGVVKDFHQYSVHVEIPAFYMVLNSGTLDKGGGYAIRIKDNNKEEAAAYVRNVFRDFFPDAIIDVTTFDNNLDFGTKGVWEIVEKIFFGFAIIAILIAANGLFGMISFAAQRRMKEIGVRKVFGASSRQLYILMSKEFAFILLIAVLVAFPSGYFISKTTPGAYKYQMQFFDYFFSIGIMIITAIAATTYHTTKAIYTNPVETLRDE